MTRVTFLLAVVALLLTPSGGFASRLRLGPEELVQAGAMGIQVPGYSVPSLADWNNDGLADLIVGEGDYANPGKVRIYLNVGTESEPQFADYSYAQSGGADLTVPASGCLGCFPRVIYWDADGCKDLLVGLTDGTVRIFQNAGTDDDPMFDAGVPVQVSSPGFDLDVGNRATPTFLDWNDDGKMDLVVGGLDGRIHLYINCGCGGAVPPRFYYTDPIGDFAQEDGADLAVPSARSSPEVIDLDGDGKKDLLTGNTEGELLLYRNVGTNAAPRFSGYSLVESDGTAINLAGSPRSRPFVCDWTGDGYLDVLIGAGDGKIHLYQSVPQPGDMDKDYDVDFADFALFTIYWEEAGCGQCDGADLTGDGNVNSEDLQQFAACWLAGVE